MPQQMLALLAAALFAAPAHAAQDKTAALAGTCNACHGVNGVSAGESMPSIGGLSEAYLNNVMQQWKTGERYSATMGRLIKGYSNQQIADLAKYFAAKPWVPVAQPDDGRILALGEEAVGRCTTCHGDTGSQPDDDGIPYIHGQWAKYMELEMMKYRDKEIAMPYRKMRSNAQQLNEADVSAVAKFFAAQPK